MATTLLYLQVEWRQRSDPVYENDVDKHLEG